MSKRETTWDNIANIFDNYKGAWLLGGDLNDVLDAEDKLGGNPINIQRSQKIWNKINYCNRLDPGFKGGKFTWYNNNKIPNTRIKDRLNRVFANDNWIQIFPNSSVIYLPRTHSDHNPILINIIPRPVNTLPKPFRMETHWCRHPQFKNIVSSCWNNRDFVQSSKLFKSNIIELKIFTYGDLVKKKFS